MVVRVDRVPVATDVVGGIVDGERLDRIDLIVGDPDRVSFIFGERLGVIAIKVFSKESIEEMIFEF